MKNFVVIAYDVIDNKRRRKIAILLKNFGVRVQYSIFECVITKRQIEEIKQKAEEIIKDNDNMRFYIICENCVRRVETIGVAVRNNADQPYFMY